MATLYVNPNSARLKALKFAVDMNIDMLNDLVLDPMWMSPQQLRELAAGSDNEIRTTMNANSKEAYENIDKLVALEFIRAELNEIE